MQNIKCKKEEVLTKLRENRKRHREIFLEAQNGFRKEVTRQLEERLERARHGRRIDLFIRVEEPSDQTRDYDRAIAMLEMALGDEVELSESDFAQFVMDDWGWKRDFLLKNSTYSGTALMALEAEAS